MSNRAERPVLVQWAGAAFGPGQPIIKAAEREQWMDLAAARAEACRLAAAEVAERLDRAEQTLRREGEALIAERLAALEALFTQTARQLDAAVLDTAIQLTRRIVEAGDPEALFARAAQQLRAMGAPSEALRVRHHPEAGDNAAAMVVRLFTSSDAAQVTPMADPSMDGRHALVVETPQGDVDFGLDTQLRRLSTRLKQALAEHEARPTGEAADDVD